MPSRSRRTLPKRRAPSCSAPRWTSASWISTLAQAAVDLSRLQIADPFALTRNLLEADEIRLKFNPEALAEKKLVIERLSLSGMRFGTDRKTPARPVEGGGFAPRILQTVDQWTKQFDVPLLSLTPIDTIRQLALDPTQLTTIREAAGAPRTHRLHSKGAGSGIPAAEYPRQRWTRPVAWLSSLSSADPKKLGPDGTRQAIQSVQETLRQIDAAKKRLETLERNTRTGVQLLGQGTQLLDQARQKDFAFAKSLLKLPSFSAPDIGSAFFGKVSIERFKEALYWAELAQQYMPPGLLPRPAPGPQRLRAAGATLEFPKEKEFPRFLLEQGQLDFSIGGTGAAQGAYQATVRGLTSTPTLYGRPAVIQASRRAAGSAIAEIDVMPPSITSRPALGTSATARLRGIKLPSFDIPGIPFRVVPGTGTSSLDFHA